MESPLEATQERAGAEAQAPERISRVGFLHPGDGHGLPDSNATTFDLLRQGLKDLGWIEGTTVVFEPRYARDEVQKLPALAAELVRLPVDVLVTVATAATEAARNATTTIPIVMLVGDPVSRLKGTDALIIVPDPLFAAEAERLATLTLRARLPATMDAKLFAQHGGLMAAAPDYVELYRRRIASQIDKLLPGAKASELPVEQSIPPSLLARADQVIE